MKVSYNWLTELAPFQQSPQELAVMLSKLGLAVDALDEVTAGWSGVEVGRVLTCEPVAGSDHLSYCKVEVAGGRLMVVCGAPNVAAGQLVPVAVPGAVLPGNFKITERKMRGLPSQGMICSERELGISDEKAGILVLPEECRVGEPLEKHYKRHDWVLDLDVTFNRPDCLSHLGVAREIAAAAGVPLQVPDSEFIESEEPAAGLIKVEIQSPERCPRYTARVVKGATMKPSPLWLQERLRNCGVRPINNTVDVTNYLLLELGHPLHAFDYHLIADGKIVVRTARGGEDFTTLDGKAHKLAETDLLIADARKGVALAGVMGGLNSEIRDDTRDILIECAAFAPDGIRVTSRSRGLVTESSRRFERGVDVQMTDYASRRAARMIKELAGGEVARGAVDNYPVRHQPVIIPLRPQRVNRLLATAIASEEMAQMLASLGCAVRSGEPLQVTAPSWRGDLKAEIDLVEEVARRFGYDNIAEADSSALPLHYHHQRERQRRLTDRFKGALVELGMLEAVTPILVSAADLARIPEELSPVAVQNPLSDDMNRLRPTMMTGLLRAVERNLNAGETNVRLFEWGRCFHLSEGSLREGWRLGGVISGDAAPAGWSAPPRPFDVYDLKGVLQQFCLKVKLDSFTVSDYHIAGCLQFGGAVSIGSDSAEGRLGWFGKLDPRLTASFGIDIPVWSFELDGDRLLASAGRTPHYRSLPRYPAARRDLAFVVEESVSSGTIEEALKRCGGGLLEAVELFDRFRGGSLPLNKKSLAYHLVFRSTERTLADAEVDALIEEMVSAVHQQCGGELRKM